MKLQAAHIDHLLKQLPGMPTLGLVDAYLSPGSLAYCLIDNKEPVFAGGVVNLQWKRGEAWILPTPYFRTHVKTCYEILRDMLPVMAVEGNFRRIQATCSVMFNTNLFRHLGFNHEGIIRHFGPNGEDCFMYSRVFNK